MTELEQVRTDDAWPPSAPAPTRWRSWLLTAFKVGLSLLAIGVLAFTVDISAAWQRASEQNPLLIVAALCTMLLQICLGALRWHLIVQQLGAQWPFWVSFRFFYIGVFFNSYLWGGVGGDVLRGWLAYKRGLDGKTAANSVILDRVAALAGVSILVLATAPQFLSKVGGTMMAFVPLGLAAIGLAGIVVAAQLERIPTDCLRSRALRLLQALGAAFRMVFLHPTSAAPPLACAIGAQIGLGMASYIIANSLGIDVAVIDCLVLMQAVVLVTSLPISIGGWGVRESAVVVLFGLVGVPSSAALVLSLQLGFLSLLVALPGGVLWLRLPLTDRTPNVTGP